MIELKGLAPVLVFGGPYSNLEATRALRNTADRLQIPPSRVICTGDVVAYCANPEETARLVSDWGCHVIQGNCEQQLAEGAPDCACNFEEGTACAALAKGWYPYALERVSEDMRAWMGGLPEQLAFRIADRTLRIVHGSSEVINGWVFGSQTSLLDADIARTGADIVIAGHAGMPFIVRRPKGIWFNPGVIGMPANDGTTDVWYGLIQPDMDDGLTLSTHRLPYDHHSAAAAMRRSGHANGYARTLVTGLWPSLDILPEVEKERTGQRIRPRRVRLTPVGRAVRSHAAA